MTLYISIPAKHFGLADLNAGEDYIYMGTIDEARGYPIVRVTHSDVEVVDERGYEERRLDLDVENDWITLHLTSARLTSIVAGPRNAGRLAANDPRIRRLHT